MSGPKSTGPAGSAEHSLLLPWYVAGTLEPDAAREVEAHLKTCSDCRAEAAALVSLRGVVQGRPRTDHVGSFDLVLYESADSGMPPFRRSEIERHVRQCSECSGDLETLRRARREDMPSSRWVTVRAPARLPLRRLGALAAGLLVATGATAYVILSFGPRGGRGEEALQPVRAVSLAPPVRGDAGPIVLEAPGPWSVSLVLPFRTTPGTYLVELHEEDTHGILRGMTRVKVEASQTATLLVGDLPAGRRYAFVVRPAAAADGASLAEYPFTVSIPGADIRRATE